MELAQGVSLMIDEQPSSQLAFSACFPNGCIVPLQFEAATVAELEAGNVLRATAVVANPVQTVALEISLRGFTAAWSRVAVLMS